MSPAPPRYRATNPPPDDELENTVPKTPQPPRSPRVVAELGRPETPGETAARKAESSRRHRSNQTLLNLVFALLASLGVVLFIVLVVVRPSPPDKPPIDFRSDAAKSESTVGHPLAAPDLSAKWTANSDGVSTGSDNIVSWNIGLISPSKQFIALVQGIDANPTWVSNELNKNRSTGTRSLGGLTWDIYDRRDQSDVGNYAYSMTTVLGVNTIVLHGTATDAEFATLAVATLTQLKAAEK